MSKTETNELERSRELTNHSVANEWVAYRQPRPRALLRLFCIPYAGGGAAIYRQWSELLPAQIEVCPIQLPGRENRLSELPYRHISPLIERLGPALVPYLDMPYAFFGHSMGALISFELARHLHQHHHTPPMHLFVSARRAPQLPEYNRSVHDLPEPEFIEELRRLQGTPEEILRTAEILQLLLPVIRADFALCETYNYQETRPLVCPISAFGGLQDRDISRDDLIAWGKQTQGGFTLRFLPGNHFFIHSARANLLQTLAGDLLSYT